MLSMPGLKLFVDIVSQVLLILITLSIIVCAILGGTTTCILIGGIAGVFFFGQWRLLEWPQKRSYGIALAILLGILGGLGGGVIAYGVQWYISSGTIPRILGLIMLVGGLAYFYLRVPLAKGSGPDYYTNYLFVYERFNPEYDFVLFPFMNDSKVVGADPFSFSYVGNFGDQSELRSDIYRDKHHVIYQGKVVQGSTPHELTLYDGYATDGAYIYMKGMTLSKKKYHYERSDTIAGFRAVESAEASPFNFFPLPASPPPPCPEIRSPVSLRSQPLKVPTKRKHMEFELTTVSRPAEYIHNEFQARGRVIADRATGLMWQKSGSRRLNYRRAQKYIAGLNRKRFAGHADWRVPTIPELLSLLEPNKQSNGLFINPLFHKRQDNCWSADMQDSSSLSSAWIVTFYFGDVYRYTMDTRLYVRAVRTLENRDLTP